MQDLGRYTKKTHIEIHTKYLSFLAVVSIALVGLVFALGVLVGSRQNQRQSVCPKLDALAVLDVDSKEPMPSPPSRPPKLSFHDALAKTSPSVPVPASLQGNESPNTSDDKQKASLKPVDLNPKMSESPIPESVPRDEPGIYSLQVGSFQDKHEANEMVRQLQRAGYGAFLVSVNMPDRGGLWYRVRVGPFNSKQEVWDKKKMFEDKERIPTFVVKRRAEG